MAAPIAGIAQIAFTVRDVPRAVVFYRDALGLTPLPIPAPPTMAFFDAGGVRLMLSTNEGTEPGGGTFVYFRTPAIREAHETLAARGVAFFEAPHRIATLPDREVWLAAFRDPDGNPLALRGEVGLASDG